jgi:hypothetical protein
MRAAVSNAEIELHDLGPILSHARVRGSPCRAQTPYAVALLPSSWRAHGPKAVCRLPRPSLVEPATIPCQTQSQRGGPATCSLPWSEATRRNLVSCQQCRRAERTLVRGRHAIVLRCSLPERCIAKGPEPCHRAGLESPEYDTMVSRVRSHQGHQHA